MAYTSYLTKSILSFNLFSIITHITSIIQNIFYIIIKNISHIIIKYNLPFLHLHTTSFTNIAFIMDGNRRFAKAHFKNMSTCKKLGFMKMLQISHFCKNIGIKEVSFFALSHKNILNRSKNELKSMLNLIKYNSHNFINQNMKIKVYGQLNLFEKNIQNIIHDIEEKTRMHTFVVNIFLGYSSKYELMSWNDSNYECYKKRIEILVRTSGEKRLSDFMLWQVSDGCNLVFCKVMWPEITLGMLSAILLKCEMEKRLYY